jgi:hypothetical protein
LAALAALIEAAWLALWPAGETLSHSPAFNVAMLERQVPATVSAYLAVWLRVVLPPPAETERPVVPPVALAADAPVLALAAVLAILGIAYVTGLYMLAWRGTAPRGGLAIVLGGAVLFQATLTWMPVIFSQDVFSYIAYGRLAALYALNPSIWPPSAIAKDVVVPWVAEVWRNYPAPYGPVWLDVQWLLAARLAGWSIVDHALMYRALGDVLLLINLGLAWQLLGRLTPLDRTERLVGLAALAWNPLVLFETAGNAHNDALMVTFSLLALVCLVHRRDTLAGGSFALGALVKYLPGMGLLWLFWAMLQGGPTWRRRSVVPLATLVLTASVALAAPWMELPDSLDPLMSETTSIGYVNALPDMLTQTLIGALPLDDPSRERARDIERVVVLTLFAGYLIWEARQIARIAGVVTVARATARACLVSIVLVSPSVQPWYFSLPLALAVVLGASSTVGMDHRIHGAGAPSAVSAVLSA